MKYKNYSDYLNHPIFKVIRGITIKIADRTCEICGKNQATEVHHIQYPVWGAFDVPSNMKAICHDCHRKEHRKRT